MLVVDLAVYCGTAALLSASLVFVSFLTETATYKGLVWLEKRKAIERLSPQIPATQTHYQKQTVLTFFLSAWAVLLVGLHPAVWRPLVSKAQPSWNVLEGRFNLRQYQDVCDKQSTIAATCWLGVAAHDFWFYAWHTLLHKAKYLYRTVHVIHHRLGGDLNVFGTADMAVVEALVMVFGFYAAVLLFYVQVGYWNPIAYTALVLLEANMNMMGHCGYRQPLWLALLQTGGVCLTPGAAHAKTHYIHHLDPRYNRALYFSWWDRMGGTFRDKHPHIKEFTPAEQWEYETRAFRMLYTWMQQRVKSVINAA